MKRIFLPLLACALVTTSLLPVRADTLILRRGDIVNAKLQQKLSSKTSHNGDTFTMLYTDGFFHRYPALRGALIEGHVEGITPAGPVHKATMSVFFDAIKFPDGSETPILAKVKSMQTFEPKTHHLRDVALVVSGAVAGHMVAKRTGSKGGTIAGAAAGLALSSTLKSDIVVSPGTVVTLRMDGPLSKP